MVEQYDFAAWTYINLLWTNHGWSPSVWGDSRVQSNPEVLQWFEQNVVNDPRYIFG